MVLGSGIIWVGVYLLLRNPSSKLSWVIFFFLFGFGITTFTDPVLLNARSLREYVYWQKLTDWPLFLSPIFYFHSSILIDKTKKNKVLIIGYLLGFVFSCIDVYGGLILKENVLRFIDYKRFDGFAAGPLLVPSILFVCIYLYMGIINFWNKRSENYFKYLLPAIGGLIYLITGVFGIVSYFLLIPTAGLIFMIGTIMGVLLFIYSMIRYHLVSQPEVSIFDKTFWYKSTAMTILLLVYIMGFRLSGLTLTFPSLVLMEIVIVLVMFSHSFYDWLSTFINDLIYNPSAGFSVVSDEEVSGVLKNFNQPGRIESSSLMRLRLLSKKIISDNKLTPVDALQDTIKEAIEHFKPKEEESRRIKQNLKYQLLRMLVFDEAEEGQILWELGFEYYPVKIMSQERKYRPPIFEIKSPADYTYASRNAFLALKKEAIHDIAWRISYLEKLSRK
jgi:hypothetical protein